MVALVAALTSTRPARGQERGAATASSEQEARDPDYLRTFLEMTLFLGVGTLAYWIQRDKNAFDWDYDGWTGRFEKEALRYDNNALGVNFIGHAMSGTAYYGFSRANRLGVFGALTSAFLTSFTWEFLLEFREKISINDTLVTPASGVVFGEFLYRLAQYVNSAPGGGGTKHRALKWSVGLPLAVHRAMDGEGDVPADQPADARGFDARMAARFRLAYGAGRARGGEGDPFLLHQVAFDGTIVALPGYLRPGRFGTSFKDANITSLRLRGRFAGEGLGVTMGGDTVILGHHRQRIDPSGSGPRGLAAMLGMSMAYLYRADSYDDFQDQLALLGLPGLALDAHFFAGPAAVHLGLRMHGEFGGVRSAAFEDWLAANPDERAKTVLTRHSYYFGWGGSGRVNAEVHLPFVQLGAAARLGAWASREGLDRNQEELTADVRGRDRALDWEAWLRVLPFDFGLFLELTHRARHRWSWLEGFHRTQRLRQTHLSLGLLR